MRLPLLCQTTAKTMRVSPALFGGFYAPIQSVHNNYYLSILDLKFAVLDHASAFNALALNSPST
jgi:hypothetical protein